MHGSFVRDTVAATFTGLRPTRAASHGRALTFLRNIVPTTVLAPRISNVRRYQSPPLLIRPTRSFLPLAWIRGGVKRNKTDAADAEAISEAVARPNMRFVPIKTREQ